MKNALGHFAYVLESIKSLANIKPYKVTAKADGKVITGDYIFGAVANSTSIAGVLKLKSDEVDINDGKFEIILAKNPKNAQELNELIGAVFTANLKSPMLNYFKASKVEFCTKDKITWTLDGEQMDGAESIIVENLTNRIKLIR
jgi:diacylglycerol kinase family enzyme